MSYKYVKPTNFLKIRPNDRLATLDDINEINDHLDNIIEVSQFYRDNLSQDKIDYVYKDDKNINILPVKYKLENFPHLTGLNFGNIPAKKQFINLITGENNEPIIIERQNRTIQKIKILDKLLDVLNPSSTTLTQLKKVKQAQRIGFSKAIKNSNNELLLALQNFQPEFYQPKSLLNISKKNAYDNIPENTILGIFKEVRIPNGIHIEPISLNKDSLNNIAVTTEMLISMSKYADSLNKSK